MSRIQDDLLRGLDIIENRRTETPEAEPQSELLDRTPPHDRKAKWPKDIVVWQEGRTGYMSVPFTWLLPKAQWLIDQGDLFLERWIVGGPATKLMPNYLQGCTTQHWMPGVLQRINPLATRTTLGCTRNCAFCGVRKIEGEFKELEHWPNLPIICDNNLLAASVEHFHYVMDCLLMNWDWCDFNQGLDARLLTTEYAKRISEIRKPIVRLALDHDGDREVWANAYHLLREQGVAKSHIRTYVLCGWRGTPEDDWRRCEFVESFGTMALPMWYHPLNTLKHNPVQPEQAARGWDHDKRRQLMRWYYKHTGSKPQCVTARQNPPTATNS